MSYLAHLSADQRAALRQEVQGASDEVYGDRALRRAEAELAMRGLTMVRRLGGLRVYQADAPSSLPLAMLPDADAVLVWVADRDRGGAG